MSRTFTVILLFAVGAGSALAAGYDDFSRGVNANNRGDTDAAITAFSAALTAGDLATAYVPNARFGRARAYLQKNKCAEALADLDEVVKLKANNVDAYLLRGAANACLNKPDAAQTDFNTAISMHPNADAFGMFARYQWDLGLFSKAADSFAQAVKVTPRNAPHKAYAVLWFAIAADRGGTLDQKALAALVSDLRGNDWPLPLLDYYLGTAKLEKVYREAGDRDAQIAANRKCEADFYIAEWHLARNDGAAAKPLLQQAVNECPHDYIEYSAAQNELKRQP